MARKTRRSTSPASSPSFRRGGPSWPAAAALGLVGAALGSGGTYFALRPALIQASSTRALSGEAALALGNTAFDQKNWAQAVSYYTQAIANDRDTPDIRTDLGTSFRYLHQPRQALEQFGVAQREDPHHENSLLNQGIVYEFDLHDSKRAVEIWQQYLQRFPQGQHVADAKTFIAAVQARGAASTEPPKP